jgi:uncharacterized protein (TIGR01568 family)
LFKLVPELPLPVMKSPAVPAKKRHGIGGGAGFALGCGCKDAMSVSVSASPSPSSTTTTRRRSGAGTTTDSRTSASSFSIWEEAVAELRHKKSVSGRLQEGSVSTASFSGLLRELSELEKSVASWSARNVLHDEGKPSPVASPSLPQEHRKAKKCDDDKGDFRGGNKGNQLALGVAAAGLEGSVAVVKQSDDPLGDFRRSMLQLIVENGIVAGEDLREMLRRFLTLNSPHHHDAILRAFAEIWDDVFVAASLDQVPTPGRASASRHEQGREAVPRTPPRHRRSPAACRV